MNICLLNLPHKLRVAASSMMMVGIIQEAKSLNPYLQVSIDELKRIDGMELFDSFRKENFLLRTRVALSVLN